MIVTIVKILFVAIPQNLCKVFVKKAGAQRSFVNDVFVLFIFFLQAHRLGFLVTPHGRSRVAEQELFECVRAGVLLSQIDKTFRHCSVARRGQHDLSIAVLRIRSLLEENSLMQ